MWIGQLIGIGIAAAFFFVVFFWGPWSTISEAMKTAPGLGVSKRWGLAVTMYAGFLFTLPFSAKLLIWVTTPIHEYGELVLGVGGFYTLLWGLVFLAVAAPGWALLDFVAGRVYRMLGARVPEEARRAFEESEKAKNWMRAKNRRYYEKLEQAARAEEAERAAKDRIDRRF